MRKWHKWIGLLSSFFIIMFALSGIFLNHRNLISKIDISRGILPKDYRYDNWNNAAVKGSFKIAPDSILLYGANGTWFTDSITSYFSPFEDGMKKGMDNKIIASIVEAKGEVFAISTFDLYQLGADRKQWLNRSERIDSHERFSDLVVKEDSLFLLSRSHVYASAYPFTHFEKIELKRPRGYERKASMFRFMWTLHSGELFHLPGQLFVDLLGAVSIFFCLTGVVIMFFPKIIRRRKRKKKDIKPYPSVLKTSHKWHRKLGYFLLVFMLILVVSGTFLRPPLLIAIIRSKVSTIPGTALHSDNAWFEKLRRIKYDTFDKEWIFYSSEGFYSLPNLKSTPRKMRKEPPSSVMGVTVMEQLDGTQWLVGSFSGLYYWDKRSGNSVDALTGKPYVPQRGGRPTVTNAVAGYSEDFGTKKIAFSYGQGAQVLDAENQTFSMPESVSKAGRMSLWHLSLEVHVGRIYSPIIGLISNLFADLFIFISGVLFLSILLTGYVMYRRQMKKKKKKQPLKTESNTL